MLFTLALTLTLTLSSSLIVGAMGPDDGTWLVRLGDGLSPEQARTLLARQGLAVVGSLPQIHVWQVSPADGVATTAERGLAALTERGEAAWSEPNGAYSIAEITPDDTYYAAKQWNLRLIGLPEAWMYTTGNSAPIAIIDTGVDLDHPDLWRKIWRNADEEANGADDDGNGYVDDLWGWDFANDDATPQDDHSHGSHVAGIAAAETDNATGVAGVSWGATIMPLKALNQSGDGSWFDIADAILYAAGNGARVINLSLGGPESSQVVADAVLWAQSKDALIVAAAGNIANGCLRYPYAVLYPAALPGVIAVAGVTDADVFWTGSCRGAEVDVAAPAPSIYSCSNADGYTTKTGTSMATPHVSGLAALLWSLNPADSAAQVTYMITSTAKDIDSYGWDEHTGWGRIDAAGALQSVFLNAQVSLQAGRDEVFVRRDTAPLTVTVMLDGGTPPPDGIMVSLETDLGAVTPATALTSGGIVTATFSCDALLGAAHIRARAAGVYSEPVTVTVRGYESHFPFVRAPWSGVYPIIAGQTP